MCSDDDTYLRELRIELLQKCTLACIHCSAESSPSASRSLKPDLVIRLLREAQELGLERVIFTGGEPLIDPNLLEYVGEAHRLGVRSTIFTAGFLKADISAHRIKELAHAGLGQVNVSLYALDPRVNAQITRKLTSLASSQAVLQAAIANGLETEIHFVPMAPNLDHLTNIVVWAEKVGVTRISVLRYVPQGRGRLADDILAPAQTDERRLQHVIETLKLQHPNLQIHVGPSFGFLGLCEIEDCGAGFSTLSIRSDGLAFPCDAFKGLDDSHFLPNGTRLDLTKSSLSEVWKNCPYLHATREFISTNTKPGDRRCASGCVSERIYRTPA
jgi:MoaA/NifB/PqqE/SkfB family radical SAM enzyme